MQLVDRGLLRTRRYFRIYARTIVCTSLIWSGGHISCDCQLNRSGAGVFGDSLDLEWDLLEKCRGPTGRIKGCAFDRKGNRVVLLSVMGYLGVSVMDLH